MTTLQLRLAPIRDHDKCNSGIQAPSTSVNGINGQISESKERYLSAVIEARSMTDRCRETTRAGSIARWPTVSNSVIGWCAILFFVYTLNCSPRDAKGAIIKTNC